MVGGLIAPLIGIAQITGAAPVSSAASGANMAPVSGMAPASAWTQGRTGPSAAPESVAEPILTELPVSGLQISSGVPVLAPEMPSWFVNGLPGLDANLALQVLADAASHGLDPADYQVEALAAALSGVQPGADPQELVRLDAALSRAVVAYLTHLHDGRLSPDVLKHRFKAPAISSFDARSFLIQARYDGRLAQAFEEAQPQIPMYQALRKVMNDYRAMGQHPAWDASLPPLPGRSLKPGQGYAGLDMLAARLAALGDLAGSVVPGPVYTGELVEGVKRFQTRHGLEADGVIGPATLAQLEISPAQRVAQMAITLERLRWTPLQYGSRMIVVNIPEFMLRAYEIRHGAIDLSLEMRVVVGKALNTQTPIFLDEVRAIEFSPYWNVPPSIARSETLPRLRRDPGYFDRQGFEFVSRSGAVSTVLTDEAIAAVQRGEWRLRQRPGPYNAMGDIKFIMPNDQNIYLHHTPTPHLFARVRRDLSHGCIRVETPVALAEFLLQDQPEWTAARIEQAMHGGKSRTVRLNQPVPVLLAYSTVVVKDGGKVYFLPDIYQQDARLEQALRQARPLAS